MTKILVIEDNEMIQEILSERLLLRNFEIVVAGNGQEGLDKAQQERPDLILMDVSLPVLDGLEATRRLRTMADIQHTPVIALTAHALAEDRDNCLAAGCNDFETKPINFTSLIKKITALVGAA
ncbi:MAG: response regulator [Anaerolinea sp.]|nr:response regulator [Anaerolinea sp.]